MPPGSIPAQRKDMKKNRAEEDAEAAHSLKEGTADLKEPQSSQMSGEEQKSWPYYSSDILCLPYGSAVEAWSSG